MTDGIGKTGLPSKHLQDEWIAQPFNVEKALKTSMRLSTSRWKGSDIVLPCCWTVVALLVTPSPDNQGAESESPMATRQRW
jgi:hypothetical protein